MSLSDVSSLLPPALLTAIENRGYTELTEVQRAVLDPGCEARDLRITSQTGSGKTLAIGFALRALATELCPTSNGIAQPRALCVAPTRELAHQVEQELAWLYADTPARIASTTGGASYRDEHRALAKGPSIVVGTPGRLLDHLTRGRIDSTRVGAVVLDEADRMLDLGFRADLDAIFERMPAERRTHMVSATFSREVRTLAERIQKDPVHVEGTRLGAANADIDHVIHIVDPAQRFDAIVNLLLATPEAQTLIFVRMRADATTVGKKLALLGFAASSLSGEMEQSARNQALSSFKRGDLRVLVATDVAARGIDVQDIARVIHAEPPTNGQDYTHRSGRTGRAGRKGTSSLLVAPAGVVHATRLLRGLGVAHRFEPIPSAEQLRRAADERIFTELNAPDAPDAEPIEHRAVVLAQRLIATGNVERTLARLLVRFQYAGVTAPREVRSPSAPVDRSRDGGRGRGRRDDRREAGPEDRRGAGARAAGPGRDYARPERAGGRTDGAARGESRTWVPFRVSSGQQHGADPRRLLAIACRRGDIAGTDVGAIRVERSFSIVNVASEVAAAFEQNTQERDVRDPSVMFRRDTGGAPARDERPRPKPFNKAPREDGERPKRFDKGPRKGPPAKWGKWSKKPDAAKAVSATSAAPHAAPVKKGGDKPLARRPPKKG
jgi:ATP-dependent RNA helicase DeaD